MQQDAHTPYVPEQGPHRRPRRPYRSLFWAIVLIGAGVIWLLLSTDVLTNANARMLALLWPILLVGLGFDLLLGRRSMALGALVGVVTMGLIVVLMLVGASHGWMGSTKLVTETRNVPLGQATSARISIDTGPYGAEVHALPLSNATDRSLLAATVNYTGTLRLDATGDTQKVVALDTQSRGWWLPWFDGLDADPWDIGLDPTVPIDLDYQTSSGTVVLRLGQLTLTGLRVGVSSGDTTVELPASAASYATTLQLSSGDLKVQAPAGARLDMKIDISSGDATLDLGSDAEAAVDFHGSSGKFELRLAAGQACRVEVRQLSSGDVDLPSGFMRVSEGEGKEGVWETQGYASAAHKILVTINISSGSVRVTQ